MTSTTNENRENFLDHLAGCLKYERHSLKDSAVPFMNDLPHETLNDLTQDELLEVLKKQCAALHCQLLTTSLADLPATLATQIQEYGEGSMILPDDPRFEEYGLADFTHRPNTYIWQKGADKRQANIFEAQRSNIGIAFAEYVLAESGTVALESSAGQGRSLHFLPTNYIAIVPISKMVPRITQATDHYAAKIKAGEATGSALNFISGPSNSGDIEMVLVEGVHGPLHVTYVVVEDC
ncbi:LutC/YkgG family protein [Enterococcus camelliae]|uniref:Lactate utilization protein C n=1 Tax=Enterococcus camelliae TaxID=453959 RepID=A0ABW5TH93_9ENTE